MHVLDLMIAATTEACSLTEVYGSHLHRWVVFVHWEAMDHLKAVLGISNVGCDSRGNGALMSTINWLTLS